MDVKAMEWKGDRLILLDQRTLPHRTEWMTITAWEEAAEAIKTMAVRGAPAIASCGAYGLALAAKSGSNVADAARGLVKSRPTAVNLKLAIDRMMSLQSHDFESFAAEAVKIEAEDREICGAIGKNGLELVAEGANILTICNTGAIATAGDGTALAIIRAAHRAGRNIHVWSCETRPRMQGLRLTAWELLQEGIPFHSIADSAAGFLMAAGKVDLVIAGADRITRNGDTANKIGTYMLAVLARHHQVLFYIAAPSTTFDPVLEKGDQIPIEFRSAEELTHIEGIQAAPEGTPVFNPAFDVSPGSLIDGFVTESGILRPPYSFGEVSQS